jgi:glycosyltransferase involved in cell wall biosynthesis
MIDHGETGLLYPFEETEILAKNICSIFEDKSLAKKLSNSERQSAQLRHSQTKNATDLNTIYKLICSN